MKVAVVSDLHVAGPGEHAETRESVRLLGHGEGRLRRRFRRGLNRVRDRFWHSHPESRAACFVQALQHIYNYGPDMLIANGDYAGDHSGMGLSDDHTYESVNHVVSLIREIFPERSRFNFGDHDIGKYNTVRRQGGIRLRSLERGVDLGLESFWEIPCDNYLLMGVNSSLLTLELYLPEALPEEIDAWTAHREAHVQQIVERLRVIDEGSRIILFSHDPSAMGLLSTLPEIRARWPQIACTVVGHLHTPMLMGLTRMMRHVPVLKTNYPIARIVTHGARGAQDWKRFNPVVCPSTYGVGHHISGGILFLEADGRGELQVTRKRITI